MNALRNNNGMSVYAQRLIQHLCNRPNSTENITHTEVAIAINSHRYASCTIAECIKCGVLREVDGHIISAHQSLQAVGQVDVVSSFPYDKLPCPVGVADSLKSLMSCHTQQNLPNVSTPAQTSQNVSTPTTNLHNLKNVSTPAQTSQNVSTPAQTSKNVISQINIVQNVKPLTKLEITQINVKNTQKEAPKNHVKNLPNVTLNKTQNSTLSETPNDTFKKTLPKLQTLEKLDVSTEIADSRISKLPILESAKVSILESTKPPILESAKNAEKKHEFFAFSEGVFPCADASVAHRAFVTSTFEESTIVTLKDLNLNKDLKDLNNNINNKDLNTARTRSKVGAKSLLKQCVAQIIRDGKSVAVLPDAEISQLQVYGMAVAYESALRDYLRKPTLKYITKRVAPGQTGYRFWFEAAKLATSLDADYTQFVRAQFWAFETWFSAPPKPHQLSVTTGKKPAHMRWQLFLDAVAEGKVDPERPILGKQKAVIDTTTSKGRAQAKHALAGGKPIIASQSVRFQYCETQLKTYMRAYGLSDEQVFRLFAKQQDLGIYFDKQWLLQNNTYRRLQAAGEL